MRRRPISGWAKGSAAAVAVVVGGLLAVAAFDTTAAKHTPFHIGCRHHSHGTTKWRDAQVKKLAERRRAALSGPASPAAPSDLKVRALTAGRNGF